MENQETHFQSLPENSVRYTANTTLETLIQQLQENNTLISSEGRIRVRTYDGELIISAQSALIHRNDDQQQLESPQLIVFSGIIEKEKVKTEGIDFNSAMEYVEVPLPVDTVVLIGGTFEEPRLKDLTYKILNPQ